MASSSLFLQRQLQKVMKEPVSEFFHVKGPVGDKLTEWEVYIVGPPNTYYENGVYNARLKFPPDYPMKPPSLQFVSKILHPNIYRDGKVCISTLQSGKDGKDEGQYWRPVLGIEPVVMSVISLFDDPNPEDPANSTAARLYQKQRPSFIAQCKELAKQSLQSLPDDFEHPFDVFERLKAKERKRSTLTAQKKEEKEKLAVDNYDDDEWLYDVEELSSDDDDEEYSFEDAFTSFATNSVQEHYRTSQDLEEEIRVLEDSEIFEYHLEEEEDYVNKILTEYGQPRQPITEDEQQEDYRRSISTVNTEDLDLPPPIPLKRRKELDRLQGLPKAVPKTKSKRRSSGKTLPLVRFTPSGPHQLSLPSMPLLEGELIEHKESKRYPGPIFASIRRKLKLIHDAMIKGNDKGKPRF